MSRTLRPDQIAAHCLDVLKGVGYHVHTEGLRIVELSFDFDKVLTGPHDHHTLVLLVDQPEADTDALRRRLSGLTLALSRTGSRRPVTLVLVAPPLEQHDLEALRKLARLVAIDRVPRTAATVDLILSEFRPLVTSDVSAPPVDALGELAGALGKDANHPQVRRLLRAAANGPDAVDQMFRTLLEEVIEDASAPSP